ncbi:elongation of very long chain fatty acids protein F-like [Drosophila nasuta]|uniref:Elongation of very long chain fatty acids protein n=1 Tax=Drosophila albomicans TaxID=7291 RepID=A0A6P8WEG2_DROAB|nr:elongation of very long chain fatty acids protein F-like [Drosophila albomicans]XP_060655079.1 elongation of very long chain fatty acids protein F-like [Drosophila nasuta]
MLNIFDIPPPDPQQLPLTNSPWPIFLILTSYILFVLKYGKRFMANRKAYNLKKVLYVYNLGQVAYNGIFFGVVFYYLVIVGICNFRCMENFPFGHKHKNLERYVHFAYFINKILDLLDTVFFVLRKKYRQISFLHVYHHIMMVLGCYMVMRFYGTGGHFNVLGMVNSFVHTVMYFYYFLSALYPGINASIWWKKYITITQLLQFVLVFSYASYVFIFSKGCGFPKPLLLLQIVQAIVMIYMFGNFYIKTYIRPQQKAKVK